MIVSAVAAMLARAPGIALIYGRRFVDTRSPGIAAVASGRHVGTRFPDIVGRFVGCGHYLGICSRHYVCMRSPGIVGWFVDICGCRLVGRCHYLSICSLLGRFAGGYRYVGICSPGIAICSPLGWLVGICSPLCSSLGYHDGVCGGRYVSTRSPGIALICLCYFRRCSCALLLCGVFALIGYH